MKHDLRLVGVGWIKRRLSEKEAPGGLETKRITRKVNRKTSGGVKGVRREERSEGGREGGVVAMPANGCRGGTKIRDHRKTEGKREGEEAEGTDRLVFQHRGF